MKQATFEAVSLALFVAVYIDWINDMFCGNICFLGFNVSKSLQRYFVCDSCCSLGHC